MINFHRIFLNPLDDRQVTFHQILHYGGVSLGRMSADNPGGVLTPRINATTVALNALESGVTDELTKLAIQKAKTEAKEGFRETLPTVIAKIHGAVVGAFGPNAPQVTECFPQGRSIFQTCKDQELNNHLQQLVNCIVPLSAQVGANAVSEAGAALSSWTALYVAQQQAVTQKKMTEGQRATARGVLRMELYKNVLVVAGLFLNDTEKCDFYCPQHLLRNAQSPQPPGEAVLTSNYAGGLEVPLLAHAEGADKFIYERRMEGETDWSPVAQDVPADENGDGNYTNTLPAPGHYEFRVRPFNGDAEGTASNIVLVAAD